MLAFGTGRGIRGALEAGVPTPARIGNLDGISHTKPSGSLATR
jgi:hypothetical protein